MRAYQAAREKSQNENKDDKPDVGTDYVEFYEFRTFLIYLELFFEIFLMFQALDKNNDKRIDFSEFL